MFKLFKKKEEKMSYEELEAEWEEQNRTIDIQTAKINKLNKRIKTLEEQNVSLVLTLTKINLKEKNNGKQNI